MIIYLYIWLGLFIMSFLGLLALGLFCDFAKKDAIIYMTKGSLIMATAMLAGMELMKIIITFLY